MGPEASWARYEITNGSSKARIQVCKEVLSLSWKTGTRVVSWSRLLLPANWIGSSSSRCANANAITISITNALDVSYANGPRNGQETCRIPWGWIRTSAVDLSRKAKSLGAWTKKKDVRRKTQSFRWSSRAWPIFLGIRSNLLRSILQPIPRRTEVNPRVAKGQASWEACWN